MPNMADLVDVTCGACGSHYQLDPSGDVAGAACEGCGGTRFFRSQPSPTQSDGTLRDMVDSDSQKDQGGNPLGEGTIMGSDGEKPRGFRDNYMHGKVASPALYEIAELRKGLDPSIQREIDDILLHDGTATALEYLKQFAHPPGPQDYPGFGFEGLAPFGSKTVAKRIEMRTLDMEPYAPLWDEAWAKTAGPLAELAAPLVEGGLGTLAKGVGINTLMKGVFGGGDNSQQQQQQQQPAVDQPPSLMQLGRADIPFLLVSDYDTPHSVKTVDEQHDDPEQQDQQEFNDGDKSPSNMRNPNNEDSGVSGEDGVRNETPGYGFGPNSPGVERAMMVLPLLLHYFQSEESGENDPIIRAIHEALEKENPGYLDQEEPDGHNIVQLAIQEHGKHPQHTGGMNAMPGGLPATPTPGTELQGPGGGRCPNCGGTLAGDGSCPQCGHSQAPQGGMQQMPQPAGGAPGIGMAAPTGGASYPPNRVSSGQGPVTPEQQQAMEQYLKQNGMSNLIPDMLQNPQNWGWLLNEIQKQPNSPPLVDPSQMTPPAPQPGMMDPSGGMPVTDPTQMGGGGGQPMQPMAHSASEYGYTCPACLYHGDTQGRPLEADCPNCGISNHTMWDDDPDLQHRLGEPHALEHQFAMPTAQHPLGPHAGKTADANNNIPRCPDCGTATTSLVDGNDGDTGDRQGRCHSCGKTFPLKESRVVLTDMANPVLTPAADQQPQQPDGGQDPSMTWQDHDGRPIQLGQTYELHAPGFDVPDQVKVIAKKPDSLGLKLVGEFANLASDPNAPDFSLRPQDVKERQYSFVPSGEADNMDGADPKGLGGMPGMEQIPQTPETTDEASNTYPNKGTMSQVLASDTDDEVYDDLCHKCGGDWIDHVASSSTTTMHECCRCGSVWETEDRFAGRESSVDLGYLWNDAQDDGFWSQMERAKGMSEYGQGSRSLSAVADKDDRLQEIRDRLAQNKHQREQHVAGRHFTPSEQRALINEKGKARNLDDLDLAGTHYITRFDPFDPTSKANPDNVPESHLLLGV